MMHQLIDKKKNIYIYLFLLFFLSTTFNFNMKNFIEKNFIIKKLDISEDLVVLELNNLINQNILYLNKDEIINILEKYPILSSFKINKIYPNTLKIELNKTKHLAKIIDNDKTFYVGENGKLFEDHNVYLNLPIVRGEVKLEQVNRFLNLLKKTSFNFNDIDFLIFYPLERWDIVFKNNTTLKLPKNNVLKLIKKVEPLLKDQNFNKKIIDLRINNKIILSNE